MVAWLCCLSVCTAVRNEADLRTVYGLSSQQPLPKKLVNCFFPTNYSRPFRLYDKQYICHNRFVYQRFPTGEVKVYATRAIMHESTFNTKSWYEGEVERAGLKPTWVPLDYWLYTGEEDPICYYQVVYDTWWFAQSNYVDHCADEMRKAGCLLTLANETHDDVELFQNKHIIKCTGIKANAARVRRGQDPNWSRVLVLNPRVLNIHGPVMVFKKGGEYRAISHLALYFSLMYDGNVFRHVTLRHDKRTDVPVKWFVYATMRDPALLANGMVFPHIASLGFDIDLEYYTSGKIGDEGCSLMGNIVIGDPAADPTKSPPVMWLPMAPMTWANMDWSLSLTCDTTCVCRSHAWSFFEDGGLEHLIIDNQEKSWIVRILDDILGWLFTLIGDAMKVVFSPSVSDGLFRAMILYLIAKHFTGDSQVSLAVSTSFLGWWFLSD